MGEGRLIDIYIIWSGKWAELFDAYKRLDRHLSWATAVLHLCGGEVSHGKTFYTKYKCQTAEHAVWKIWNLVWHPFPVSVLNDPLSQSTALEICRESTHLKSRKCYSYNYQPEFPMINSKNSLRSSIKYQRFRSLASFGSSFKSYVASTLGPCSRGFGINYNDISHWWFVSSNGAWAPDEG